MHVHGAPCFVAGVTDVFEQALGALWFAGKAKLAAMPDDLVGKQYPAISRKNLYQVLLDFLRLRMRRELQSPRDTPYMRVHDHSLGFLEPSAQHDVGSFARDSGQG